MHSLEVGKTGGIVISSRFSNLILICSVAAVLGAVSGNSLDTEPLRWGSLLRDHLPPKEAPSAVASRMYETFEQAKRPRPVSQRDYLTEDDVIYLPSIDAGPGRAEVASFGTSQRAEIDLGLTGGIQADPVSEPRQAQLEFVGGASAGPHRVAEAVAGPSIVHFPSDEGGGEAPRGSRE